MGIRASSAVQEPGQSAGHDPDNDAEEHESGDDKAGLPFERTDLCERHIDHPDKAADHAPTEPAEENADRNAKEADGNARVANCGAAPVPVMRRKAGCAPNKRRNETKGRGRPNDFRSFWELDGQPPQK